MRFLNILLRVETIFAGAFYAIAAAILFSDVIAREIFAQSIWGGQRIAVILANAAGLIGIGVALQLNRHIRPSIMNFALKPKLEQIRVRAGHFFAGFVFAAGTYYAVILVLDNRDMGFTTPPLDLKIWIPQLALVYGLASTSLRCFIFGAFPNFEPKGGETH